jgi:Ni,Fe-hydrogenase maturation factor
MRDLREQLERCFQGWVCLVGLGNADYGDDAFGVRLAEALVDSDRDRVESSIGSSEPELSSAPGAGRRDAAPPGGRSKRPLPICDPAGCEPAPREAVIIAGTNPERLIGQVADENFDHVIFLDAVDFGGPPGAAVILNTDEMVARFPQISHLHRRGGVDVADVTQPDRGGVAGVRVCSGSGSGDGFDGCSSAALGPGTAAGISHCSTGWSGAAGLRGRLDRRLPFVVGSDLSATQMERTHVRCHRIVSISW